ncbi:MAG: lytic transglycosylase domain-containing protein [Beijerinckiaceae bacterium]|nr:lytic transglycosylase domain-containing protein [Beijerinckiaceae bacterium]
MRARHLLFIAISVFSTASFSAAFAEPVRTEIVSPAAASTAQDASTQAEPGPISLLTGLEKALKQEPTAKVARSAKGSKVKRAVDSKQITPPVNEEPAEIAAEAESKNKEAAAPALEAQSRQTKVVSLDPAAEAVPHSDSVRSLIAHHAAANNIPFGLADAVIKVESRYNPGARNGVNLGLGQINLRTARGLGYSGGAGGLLNANTNLTYSMKYLAQAYRLSGGDTCGAVMRYQNGTASTRFTGANRAYCSKVKSHLGGLSSRKRAA